jgi:hypothetical protein
LSSVVRLPVLPTTVGDAVGPGATGGGEMRDASW